MHRTPTKSDKGKAKQQDKKHISPKKAPAVDKKLKESPKKGKQVEKPVVSPKKVDIDKKKQS